MKTNKAVKINENMVGVEVMNIQDVVKAQAAGLELVDKEGWGYDFTIVDDETGEERDPTEQEIFERITKDLAEGKEVYACMTIANDWCVQRNAKTKLLCDFYVHQIVYTMNENKIVEGEIIHLSLSYGHLEDDAVNTHLGNAAEKLYYFIGSFFTNNSTPEILFTKKSQIVGKLRSLFMDACVVMKTEKGKYLTRPIEEIFATKEELVDNLME